MTYDERVVTVPARPTLVAVDEVGDGAQLGDVILATCGFGGHGPASRAVPRASRRPRAVRAWYVAGGLELAGPNWEIYGDWNDDPAKLETAMSG